MEKIEISINKIKPISILLLNDHSGYVWSAEDCMVLRKQFQMIGTSNTTNSTTKNSLPMHFSKEQIYLGILMGAIVLDLTSSSLTKPESLPCEISSVLLYPEKATVIKEALHAIALSMMNIKFIVYLDLWLRGLHVTSASKYGGDFLIYREDPLLDHAVAVVKITSKGPLLSTVKKCLLRLCHSIKKDLVIASFHGKKVSYSTYSSYTSLPRKGLMT